MKSRRGEPYRLRCGRDCCLVEDYHPRYPKARWSSRMRLETVWSTWAGGRPRAWLRSEHLECAASSSGRERRVRNGRCGWSGEESRSWVLRGWSHPGDEYQPRGPMRGTTWELTGGLGDGRLNDHGHVSGHQATDHGYVSAASEALLGLSRPRAADQTHRLHYCL